MEAPCPSSSGGGDPGVGWWPLSRCSPFSLLVEASRLSSFHLNLLSRFSPGSPWPVERLIGQWSKPRPNLGWTDRSVLKPAYMRMMIVK